MAPIGTEAIAAGSQDTGSKATPQDLVLKVLGAVGTGVGILGFVTFFGGAILWLRAEQAELPANDAVSVIPNSVLVTTGASFLVPALLIALLAVVVIFAIYFIFNLPRQLSARTTASEAEELRAEADAEHQDAAGKLKAAEGAREMANSVSEQAAKARQEGLISADTLAQAAATQLEEAEGKEAAALKALELAARKQAKAEHLQRQSKARLRRSPLQLLIEIVVGFFAIWILPPVLNGAIFNVSFFWSGVILILVSLAAAAASAVAYLATEKFVWFGIAAFVTVGIYLGFATYYSTSSNPKVEPAAALRGERAPVVGSFIADTTNNLYLGTFPNRKRHPRLIVVPRSQVTSLTIGPLVDPEDAPERAIEMALDECRQRVDVPKTKEASAHIERSCTASQRSILNAQLSP